MFTPILIVKHAQKKACILVSYYKDVRMRKNMLTYQIKNI